MRILLVFTLLIGIGALFPHGARASEPIRAYTSSALSPLSRGPEYELPGFFHEYLIAVMGEAGLVVDISYLPWRRAQSEVATGSGMLLFGATRTPAREHSYRWVTRLITAERAFFTTGEPIDSIEDARSLTRIGARSVHARSLEQKGFDNLDPGVGASSFQKLSTGRVDAVYTVSVRARFVWAIELGYGLEWLVVGAPIEASDIWLAASPDFDPALIDRIHSASKRLIENGVYAELHRRYFGDLHIAPPADPALAPSR